VSLMKRRSASEAPPELVDVAFGEPEPAISAIALSTIASVNWLARKGA
jgi:hypothetical protein